MALAHTRPSLLGRIDAKKHGFITIPAGQSGIQKPMVGTFTERYRGTQPAPPPEPVRVPESFVSRGRVLVLGSAASAVVVLGVALAIVPA